MKHLPKHSFKKSLLATSITLALSACGSSGSSTKSFSGTVADGYLVDARVCLDLNDNKVCDEGEPSAISTAGGEFTIDGVTQDQLNLHALVVEILEGLTVDEDFPDQTIDEAYTMTAPAGYSFVSPLTTMVQQELEENEGNEDFDVEDAEEAVQTKLGTTLDLREDFVAAKSEDSDFSEEEKEEFEKLHKVAQVTARVLQDNVEAVKDAVDGTDISFDQVLDMVVGEVLEALETINQEVEDAVEAGGDFDPDVVAANDEITEEAKIDTQEVDVEAEIAVRQAEKEASAANLIDLVTSVGINWFEADHDDGELELYYGSFQHNSESGESSSTEYYYDPASDAWVAEEGGEDYGDYLLTAEGWVRAPENESISINADGSITIQNSQVPSYAERLDADQFDIAGLNIASTLAMAGHEMAWADAVDPLATFSEGSEENDGALGFKLTFTTLNDQYRMWDWDCEEDQVVGGMCNSVYRIQGDGSHETDGPAQTLASLISSAPSNATNPGQITGAQVAWMDGASIFAEMLQDGHVNYYFAAWNSDGTSHAELLADGRWDDKQVGDVSLVVMELPPIVVGMGDLDYRDRFIFFTEKDGFVRRGEFAPEGAVEHGEVVFNQVAKADILEAFGHQHFDMIAEEIADHHAEELLEEEMRDEETGGFDGSLPPMEDPTSEPEGLDLPPIATTLQACEIGDTEEDSLTGVVAFDTRQDFDAAVTQCGGAVAITAGDLVGKSFVIASEPGETLHFMQNDDLIIEEEMADGSIEEEVLHWEIIEGELIVTEMGANGLEEHTAIALLAADGAELSLKGFSENAEDYQGEAMDGSMGEIWSDVIVEVQLDQSAGL